MSSLISYHYGNLFDSEAEVIGYGMDPMGNLPTKTAFQLKKAFLEKYHQNSNYKPLKLNDNDPNGLAGKILPWVATNPLDPVIINMFIKYSADEIPNLKDVQTTLLRTMIFMANQKYPLTTLAIPKIEVANSPLTETAINVMISKTIDTNPMIAIEIWQPS